ncbi:MAG: ABC transporter ATP-binding protein [Deltaproteobacteria bacterium]|nr:ABC transporter ATP-binding protein [Deltaproteobacteria bacterium]
MSVAACELRKSFAGLDAVAGLSFAVAAGEVYGLIGPNGAGKTTTLRMLAGLLRPDAGQARICGEDVAADVERAKSRVGYLTAATGLYERLTARETLRFFGQLYGKTVAEVDARIEVLAPALRLEGLLERRCGKLSTGERQRISLARATIHDPPVLILDEPTAGLDIVASRSVADFVRTARGAGRAILFCTHYMSEAELLCDRIGLLSGGKLLAEGAPAVLKAELGAGSLEEAFLRLLDRQRGVEAKAAEGSA